MLKFLVVGIAILLTTAAIARLMLLRTIASLQCRSCGNKFGWKSAIQNKIVVRVFSVTWDEATPYLSRNKDYVHMREIRCSKCRATSTMDARGNEVSESLLGDPQISADPTTE